MKNLVYALVGAGFMIACQPSDQPEISGMLTGIESDTLLVQSFPVNDRDSRRTDTIAMQNGSFAFNLGDSVLKQVYIYGKPSVKPNEDGSIPAISMKAVNFLLLPGQPIKISGSLDEYKLEGGSFYDDYNEVLEDCKAYSHKIDSLNVVCLDMEKKGIPGDSIRKVYASAKEWYGNILKIKSDYVRQNPDKDVSVYVMSQLTRDQLGDAFNVLTDRVKEGMMAPLYQRMREGYEKELARDKAKEAMKPGNPAPEFTLKDLDGKNFDLSSLRGKYVVLDFWGSWCGWCIKGIPEMKKAYEKYKGKIEFVGIDCNDTEDKWKKAVAEHQLPWINVRNIDEPDVAVMYGVSGYPTKYVIDPEGKIAKQVVGENPEFYMYLDALMK